MDLFGSQLREVALAGGWLILIALALTLGFSAADLLPGASEAPVYWPHRL